DVIDWAVWAHGPTTREAWQGWARGPPPPVGPDMPPLTEVPPMTRRRIEKTSRLVFQVAHWVQQERRGVPIVFASRHGAATRVFELMISHARQQPISPMGFTLSVHNAVGGQYAITRGDTADVVAVGNGLFTAEAGVIEAVTLAPETVLVVYDGSPHELLAPFFPEAASDFAFALHLRRGGPMRLKTSDVTATPATNLPHALEVFRFLLDGREHYRAGNGVSGYEWSRSTR
ncbi:MAG: beta-ketoacyl synthase chain length factor, partial [Archangium sp.]